MPASPQPSDRAAEAEAHWRPTGPRIRLRKWLGVWLLEYPGGSRERLFQRCHACCPDLGRADECLAAGVIGAYNFEPDYQVRMLSRQPSPAVPG